jgi:response regulator RpfG family c-di-GMP phosphodiesterase
MTKRIMLVDDERGILNALRRMIESKAATELAPYALKVEVFESPIEALQRAEVMSFDVVLSDYRMPEMSGVAFLAQIKALQPTAMRMILSGYADMSALIAAINEAQIHSFLTKPWVDAELRASIVNALVTHEHLQERAELADYASVQQGTRSLHERELKRLQSSTPAMASVNWPEEGITLAPKDDA